MLRFKPLVAQVALKIVGLWLVTTTTHYDDSHNHKLYDHEHNRQSRPITTTTTKHDHNQPPPRPTTMTTNHHMSTNYNLHDDHHLQNDQCWQSTTTDHFNDEDPQDFDHHHDHNQHPHKPTGFWTKNEALNSLLFLLYGSWTLYCKRWYLPRKQCFCLYPASMALTQYFQVTALMDLTQMGCRVSSGFF